ncbi:MAG: hypothetical protein U0M25_04135, partial [Oscillospiraceae bacterium]|nr:hypothetical protein [Oscillospiraceae bacterium]
AKWIFVALLCNSAAAAGDFTRKETLTVSFHTFLPSETCGQAGFFGSLKRTGHSDLPAFSYVLCLLLRHCGRSDQSCRTAASSFPAHAYSSACGFCAAEIGQNGSNSVTGWNNMQNAQVIRPCIVQNRKLNF